MAISIRKGNKMANTSMAVSNKRRLIKNFLDMFFIKIYRHIKEIIYVTIWFRILSVSILFIAKKVDALAQIRNTKKN